MLNEIIKNTPKSVFDIIDPLFFERYDKYDYVYSGNCFEPYYGIAKTIKPKKIMEIGVRFGFSFLPMLLGAEAARDNDEPIIIRGLDLETYGNNSIAISNMTEFYKGNADWKIEHGNSQELTELPDFYDLISIDGCHNYGCKIHDLQLAMNKSRYAILDDYDYHADVKRSIDDFIKEYSHNIEESIYMPTFRGSMLIKFKENITPVEISKTDFHD
jgi:hypothetical protein